jgi:hypothetical protein
MTWLATARAVVPARPHLPAVCPPTVRHLPPVAPCARGSSRQAAGLLKMQQPARRAGKGSLNPGRDALCHLILLSRPPPSRSARRI